MQIIVLLAITWLLFVMIRAASRKFASLAKGILFVFVGLLGYALFGRFFVALGVYAIGIAMFALFCVFLAGMGQGIRELVEENTVKE